MEEAWTYGNSLGMARLLGVKAISSEPPYMYFLKDGVIEVWENTQYHATLQKHIRERSIRDRDFFNHTIALYKNKLKKIEQCWRRKVLSIAALKIFISLVTDVMPYFLFWYELTLRDDTPKDLRKEVFRIRKKDEFFDRSDRVIRASLQKAYPRLGRYIVYLLQKEIRTPRTLHVLQKRDSGFIFVPNTYIATGTFAKLTKRFSAYQFQQHTLPLHENQLKGEVAFPGKVRGIVRILKRKDQISAVKKGEILVSPMTTPDFIPAMKKASAIVTDEGGITCHAAIVSRELKKPCIIGTQVATTTFHTGDLVEIDSTGVIKLVTRRDMQASDNLSWSIIGGDFHSPLIRNYIWTNALAQYPKLFNLPGPGLGIISRKEEISYISGGGKFADVHDALQKRVSKDPQYLKKIIEKTNDLGEQVTRWSEKYLYRQDLRKLSHNQLAQLLRDFVEKQGSLYAHGALLPALDFGDFAYVEGTLKHILKEKISKNKFAQYFEVLTAPIHNSFAQDQEEDLLKLVAVYAKNAKWRSAILHKPLKEIKIAYPDFFHDLSAHTKKHTWVYYVYIGPAFTEEKFLDFIKEIIKKKVDPLQVLKNIKQKNKKIRQLRKRFVRLIKFSPFERNIINIVPYFVWAKPRRKDFQSKAYFHAEKLFSEIARRLGISLRLARCIPPQLLLGYLQKKPNVMFLQDLYACHVCLPESKKGIQILTGKKARQFIAKHVVSKTLAHNLHQQEITGSVAFRGQATGRVKIINTPEDLGKMKNGDVLVSLATTPSIVTAMKKAAAIVTDEGGLTCHASIVSRELEIPCVVGAKIATQVLKDGDTVHVDANKGIIKVVR